MGSPSMNINMMDIEDKVAFFLPTYNEEKNVFEVVNNIRKHFNGYLFIIDGFSTDHTVKIAQELDIPVFFRNAHGKGSAIQKALEIADENGKEFLMFMDCDRTYSAEDIQNMIQDMDENDLIIGVRKLSTIHPYFRRIGNVVATTIINLPFQGHIKDSISGFKCIRVQRFKNLMKEDGFVADALICVYALRYQMKIKLVPIQYLERIGKSKMGFWIGVKELIKLIYAILNSLIK